MKPSTQMFLVALSTALLTTGANLWLGGGDAWASPKNTEQSRTSNQEHEIVHTPKSKSAKLQYYVVQQNVSGPQWGEAGTRGGATAFCKDADDIPISGSCASQQGLVASSRHINWTVDDVKAGFQCQFYLPASGSLQGEAAEIVCQTF